MYNLKKCIMMIIYLFIATAGMFTAYFATNQDNIVSNGMVNKDTKINTITTTYNGEWELYYNKLIVTDNIDLKQTNYDALINLPNSWHNLKTKDGKTLPLQGYASYRIIVNNLHEGDIIKFDKKPSNVSMNVFVNRKKIAGIGVVEKKFANNHVAVTYNNNREYEVEYNEQVEIVIEVGYNIFGGIVTAPNFTTTNYTDASKEIIKYTSYILLIMYLFLCIVELVSYFKIFDSTLYTFNSSVCILMLFIFSPTINLILGSYNFYILPFLNDFFNFIFYALFLFFIYQFFRFTYSNKMKNKEIIIYVGLIVFSSLAYAILSPFKLQIIIFSIYTLIFVLIMLKFSYFNKTPKEFDVTFYMTKAIFYSIIGAEIAIVASTSTYYRVDSSISTIAYLFFIYIIYISIYIAFLIRTYKLAAKSYQYELQNQNLKSIILKDQIKPHFVFNSLNAIKTLYHVDLDKGDYALSLLSKHLRFNVNAINTNLIAFTKEIDNIYNFIDLENLKVENKFNIIFDIDYQDFSVPILSLQPFVENAIKYSKVNYKDDGFIEISAYCENNNIIIEINDNGVGFNVNNIGTNSCGIKNAKERFKILLNASIIINSEIGKGTNVKIIIPEGEKNEHNNS